MIARTPFDSSDDPYPLVRSLARVWFVECATCGYEPADQLSTHQGRCPKCHTFTWRRLPRPGSLIVRLGNPPAAGYRN